MNNQKTIQNIPIFKNNTFLEIFVPFSTTIFSPRVILKTAAIANFNLQLLHNDIVVDTVNFESEEINQELEIEFEISVEEIFEFDIFKLRISTKTLGDYIHNLTFSF